MTIQNAVLQGIIQGLTEFLPISSSGHLSLVQHFTGQGGEAGGMFTVLLHMGTLLAVFIAFYKTIWELIVEFFRMLGDIFTGKFRWKGMNPNRRMIFMLLLATLPLAAAMLVKDFYDAVASDNDIIVEGVCFLITAGLLFLSDHMVKGRKGAGEMTAKDALAVGVAQAIAPMPGISRSGSTICTGMMMGLSREYAVAFSFILGVPAVLGANLLEVKDLLSGAAPGVDPLLLLVGMGVSLMVGLLAIWMVKWLVKSDKFKWFGWYTLVLGLCTIGIGVTELLRGAPFTF